MPIPVNIIGEVSALNAAIAANSPLELLSSSALTMLTNQAIQLVNDTDSAISAAAGQLDSFVAPMMPIEMAAQFISVQDSGQTQWLLVLLEGYAGRLATNLINGNVG